MNLEFVSRLIEASAEEAGEIVWENELGDAVFLVDWRESDDAIVEYCESVIQTGSLSAEIRDANNEAGYELIIKYKGKGYKVPLTYSSGDRHITLCALNKILSPDFEIRYCNDANGSDTAVLMPLPTDLWSKLESQYRVDVIAKKFDMIKLTPNPFA